MRIVQSEDIYISREEFDVYAAFSKIVEGMQRESKNPNNREVLRKTSIALLDFFNMIKDIEMGGN
jgi:hypothetical protein